MRVEPVLFTELLTGVPVLPGHGSAKTASFPEVLTVLTETLRYPSQSLQCSADSFLSDPFRCIILQSYCCRCHRNRTRCVQCVLFRRTAPHGGGIIVMEMCDVRLSHYVSHPTSGELAAYIKALSVVTLRL